VTLVFSAVHVIFVKMHIKSFGKIYWYMRKRCSWNCKEEKLMLKEIFRGFIQAFEMTL
jgi:hypothetical protein